MSSHPYENLPQTSFWKTAIADIEPANIEQLWQPKFPITRESKIITVGSCFAQHISRALKQNGFDWIDSEPAPAGLPEADHASHGYGIFSFRTGNIYTAALLKQWAYWVTGAKQASTEIFLDNGRCFDPFRPSVPPEGYATPEEMFQARKATLAAIADAVHQADLLVFTLGLTEAWLNGNSDVYPMCPGTVRGEFSAANYIFHNFNEREVVRDISEAFDELRKLNPTLKLLLTVSPVPLTATASGQHVLTANTYSKSVLRSAAGYLTQVRVDVDYFPSYELIATTPFKGRFFEKNMRSVSPEGVAFVMGRFFSAIGAERKPTPPEITGDTKAIKLAGKSGTGADICDDIILETWSNRKSIIQGKPHNILLIGDSQMGMMAKALDEQGIRYAGGAIMHGSNWHLCEFSLDDGLIFVPSSMESRARWEEAYRAVFQTAARTNEDLWVITNIGMHSHSIFSKEIGIFDSPRISRDQNGNFNLTGADIVGYLESIRTEHFALIKSFVQKGVKVLWISDPPTQPVEFLGLVSFIEKFLAERFGMIGCSVFCAGNWIEKTGGLRAEYRSSEIDPVTGKLDITHGSTEYYRHLAKEIFDRFQINHSAAEGPCAAWETKWLE